MISPRRDDEIGRDSTPLGYLASLIGPPEILMMFSGLALVVGGFALALGFRTRIVAAGLCLTLIPITVTTHVGDMGHIGPLFKNLALMGGLIHFTVRGAGAYSLDGQGVKAGDPTAEA